MTRLMKNDIQDLATTLPAYDASLISRTGHSLRQLACRAMGVTEKKIESSLAISAIGVIPITSGDGELSGFCQAVSAIVQHLGARAFVTQKTDAAGIAEAVERNADILMFSDEDRFIALHLKHRKIADNAIATGKGFASALHLIAGGALVAQRVLVIGCGPVGLSAVNRLLEYGCRVSVFDIDPDAYAPLLDRREHATEAAVQLLNDIETALQDHDCIIDATPAGSFIQAKHITPKTVISAPGMPIGLNGEARTAIGDRLIHDPLQIGVATMLVDALI
jgi:3-methylornithyl-N6-L-lysine dehydrogenase